MTPDWMLQRDVAPCPCGCIGKRSKANFIDRTIVGASGVMRQALFTEDIAARPGLLQRLDPRIKAITLLALVVAVAMIRNIPVLVGMHAVAFLLAASSRIRLRYFAKRVWLFVPLFTGIVVIPATFSFVTSGDIVVPLGSWFGHRVGLTSQGLRGALLIVMRVATSISFVVMLALTTTWTKLLAALRAMFVPRMFVLVLGMAYRYVFHLLGSVTDMYEARKARTVNVDHSIKNGRAFVAATAGTVFGKAHAMSEEVHQAMVSRGYTGHPRAISAFRVRTLDICWMVGGALIVVAVLGIDRAIGR